MLDARAEAVAKLAWGEKPAEVERHLIHNGVPPARARALVAELTKARDAAFRRRGLIDVVVGALVAGGGLYVIVSARGTWGLTWLGVATAIGLGLVIRGVQRLLHGARAD